MSWKTLAVLALAVGAAAGAQAQAIYKTIGPDGKIIYSDKPPAGAGSRTTTVGKQPAPSAPGAAAEARRAARPAAATAKTPVQASPGQPAEEAAGRDQARMDPVLERALVRVMGNEDLLSRTEEVCLETLPSSSKRYNAAASGWKERNAAILAQFRRVMAEGVSEAQRERLEMRVSDTNESSMAGVLSASPASRIKWCDQSFREIESGKLDLHDDPGVADPLMSFRP
jgi:pyruvate/2-oxoglutarate dehydrogenase complex dihydrolipoamide acyltransferase (E2) component